MESQKTSQRKSTGSTICYSCRESDDVHWPIRITVEIMWFLMTNQDHITEPIGQAEMKWRSHWPIRITRFTFKIRLTNQNYKKDYINYLQFWRDYTDDLELKWRPHYKYSGNGYLFILHLVPEQQWDYFNFFFLKFLILLCISVV